MANKIKYTGIFEKYFKRYSKKYRSLSDDLQQLEKQLIENPTLGTYLGDGLYKIRLAVKSKNKGKSGGFRVITYFILDNDIDSEINLVIIYDKSNIEDIPKNELLKIVREILS